MRPTGPRHDRLSPKAPASDKAVRERGLRVPPQTREEFSPLAVPRHPRQDDMDFYAALPSKGNAGRVF